VWYVQERHLILRLGKSFYLNKDIALEYGVYEESPVLTLIDELNTLSDEDKAGIQNFKTIEQEIVMCGKD
jgi:hypothetical protein